MALAALFVFSGCGYHVAGQGSLPGGIKALCVGVPENRSSDVQLAPHVADRLVARLISGGISAQVGCEVGSRLVGEIQSVVTSTASRNSAGEGVEEKVVVNAVFRLTGNDGEVVWRSAVVSGDETYAVTPGSDSTAARNGALEEAADDLAEALWLAMTQRF